MKMKILVAFSSLFHSLVLLMVDLFALPFLFSTWNSWWSKSSLFSVALCRRRSIESTRRVYIKLSVSTPESTKREKKEINKNKIKWKNIHWPWFAWAEEKAKPRRRWRKKRKSTLIIIIASLLLHQLDIFTLSRELFWINFHSLRHGF